MIEAKLKQLKIELNRQLRFFIALKNGNELYHKSIAETLIDGNKSLLLTIEKIESGMVNATENMLSSIEEAILRNKKVLEDNNSTKAAEKKA